MRARGTGLPHAMAGWTLAVLAALTSARPAVGSPLEFLPVGDPLEAELRLLDVLGPPAGVKSLALPHLGVRPLLRGELLPLLPLLEDSLALGPAHAIALARIGRVIAREAPAGAPRPRGTTPRLFQHLYADEGSLEASLGWESRGEVADGELARLRSGSGVHLRIGLEAERWIAFSHVLIGQVAGASAFADPIVPGNDVIAFTDESYLAYTTTTGHWNVQFGRSRWHWGPGEEGSLMLSRTSAPITGLAFRARLAPIRIEAMALSATLDAARGEQLAAHRIEWQPFDAVRLGLSEAARYRAAAWQPIYLAGVIPYSLVQRILLQDAPDSASALRNNVMIGADVSWRVAPGTRLYTEWLADDLHARSAFNPNKLAYQFGWDGVGTIAGTRVTWGGEYTRVYRYVYTSFFGRDFVSQGVALGFPIAPDARHTHVRIGWDPSVDWQFGLEASHTERGENSLDEAFVPGSPKVDAATFEGVVETRRALEATARFWPAGGITIALAAGYTWIDDAGHVPGAERRGASGALEVRLMR